jgi:hypothetical protein
VDFDKNVKRLVSSQKDYKVSVAFFLFFFSFPFSFSKLKVQKMTYKRRWWKKGDSFYIEQICRDPQIRPFDHAELIKIHFEGDEPPQNLIKIHCMGIKLCARSSKMFRLISKNHFCAKSLFFLLTQFPLFSTFLVQRLFKQFHFKSPKWDFGWPLFSENETSSFFVNERLMFSYVKIEGVDFEKGNPLILTWKTKISWVARNIELFNHSHNKDMIKSIFNDFPFDENELLISPRQRWDAEQTNIIFPVEVHHHPQTISVPVEALERHERKNFKPQTGITLLIPFQQGKEDNIFQVELNSEKCEFQLDKLKSFNAFMKILCLKEYRILSVTPLSHFPVLVLLPRVVKTCNGICAISE